MSAHLTIGSVELVMIEDQYDQTNMLSERQRFRCDAIDYTGTYHFVKGEQVVVTDPVLGIIFNGFLNQDREFPIYPTGAIKHTIDCIDLHYLADKRTYTATYATPQLAGKLVVDQLQDVLLGEGVAQNFAQHTDSTQGDFGQGILSGTAATLNVDDGDLELAPAGSNLTITENTTAAFATGTLTNVQAVSNSLIPTSLSALSLSTQLPGTLAGAFIAVSFWAGSMMVGTSDTFNYDLWISSTSPAQSACVDLYFSDGTKLSLSGLLDQNSQAITPSADLSSYASNTWYTRQIALTGLNGKVINTVTFTIGGSSTGTYVAYAKNVYLGSQTGNKFLAPNATTTNISPPQIYQYLGFSLTSVLSGIVTVFNATNANRVSPAYSIDAVKLLGGSVITWSASSATGVTISASYDGGASWVPCVSSAALPALPAGTNVAGMTLTLRETLNAAGSTDPTIFPVLDNVNIVLTSAPNATKSDITTSYITSTNWNTGTFTNTILSGNNLTLGSISRNWNDNLITNQTFFAPSGVTQSASSGVYTMTTPATLDSFGASRLDFCEQLVDFILDVDLKVNNGTNSNSAEVGVTYRQISWQATVNNTMGYYVGLDPFPSPGRILFGHGSNGSTDAYTSITTSTQTVNVNTTYHLKIVVSGTRHQIYFNNGTTPAIDMIDSTYQQIGGFGFRQFNWSVSPTTSITTSWDNLVISPLQSGTWQSSAISLSSLGSCGNSAIYWTEQGTSNQALASVQIQTSIDGGSTFQFCTNQGAIPNLPSGTNVSGKTLIVKAILNTISQSYIPVLSQMVWRVLGAYPGASGTRSTVPLGNDTAIRGNVGSGFGTGTDGQTYTQVGTATTDLSGNEMQVTNTTGDVHMVYGSRTTTDQDATVRFSLSAATISGGMELRYQNSTHFYRLSASTTTLSLVKASSTLTTLATASVTLSTNVYYYLRFRVTNSGPAQLSGKVWASGTLEPTTWQVSALG